MGAYYNEYEPYAAEWLRNLERGGLIAPGRVDARSIADVTADDVRGVTQAHFFAGIGVWSHALRLAGWPDDVSVWTGSCPCQPFSQTGERRGLDDERHLWPEWFRLIRECRPGVIFGEQVASLDAVGGVDESLTLDWLAAERDVARVWFDVVCDDLERIGYTVGAVVLPACGVGAPHIRHRLFFVAISAEQGRFAWWGPSEARKHGTPWLESRRLRDAGVVGDAERARLEGQPRHGDDGNEPGRDRAGAAGPVAATGAPRGMGDASVDGVEQHAGVVSCNESEHDVGTAHRHHAPITAGATRGFWADADWLWCIDGKWRPTRPGALVLAPWSAYRVDSGSPLAGKSRSGLLKAYGNAIVPQAASAFIRSVMDLLALES